MKTSNYLSIMIILAIVTQKAHTFGCCEKEGRCVNAETSSECPEKGEFKEDSICLTVVSLNPVDTQVKTCVEYTKLFSEFKYGLENETQYENDANQPELKRLELFRQQLHLGQQMFEKIELLANEGASSQRLRI